ncbi:hypothetical protein CASFOL_040021 [Castilleja foliolosa]|uniref:Uncharacterized protein n=1 Tax=Castilleja foliolosa TaxID=1961234 RepID=A0ABD3BFE9_9LAMI
MLSPPPPGVDPSPTGRDQDPSSNNSLINRPLRFHWFLLTILTSLLVWL